MANKKGALKESLEGIGNSGMLVVISGQSGAGKDEVFNKILEHTEVEKLGFTRVVTCADRPARYGEIHGVHYHFVTPEELDIMHVTGQLVEPPLTYGTSRKATPKTELLKVLEGGMLIWRIDPSLAAQVASGDFFNGLFPEGDCVVLQKVTKVVFITASQNELEERRKKRDRDNYNPLDYQVRDKQDAKVLKEFGHHFETIIENRDGQINETVNTVVKILIGHTKPQNIN